MGYHFSSRLTATLNPTWYGLLNYLVVWGGGWKCPQGRMATEANWGQCRGYQSWQILFLTSFPICRAFEKSPKLYSFAVRGRRSHLLSPQKSSSIFELYGQYVHQMKAENILNSNLTQKSRICYIKVGESQFFMISPHFRGDFFFVSKIFQNFF